jgi:serine/threonine protein kinase
MDQKATEQVPAALTACFHEHYLLGPKLGRGAFAQVRLATRVGIEEHSQERAVKILDTRDEHGDRKSQLVKVAKKEEQLWLQVGEHPNAVRLFDTFYSTELCYMVMEKCSSSLWHYLNEMNETTERTFGNIFRQMLFGIAHVHAASVVHRDVKPDNFMMGGEDSHTVKLADYGLSAALPAEGLKGVHGTAPFMSPEMITHKSYGAKVDVWSLGVVAYSFLFGDFPYLPQETSSKAMKQAIINGKQPAFSPAPRAVVSQAARMRSDSAVAFAKTLLHRQPENRPSALEALDLPYMAAIGSGSHMSEVQQLPSLRPMLHSARKAGAFEVRDPTRESPIDELLNTRHFAKHGEPVPQTRPVKKPTAEQSGHKGSCNKGSPKSSEIDSNTTADLSTTTGGSTASPTLASTNIPTRVFHKSGWSKSISSDSRKISDANA